MKPSLHQQAHSTQNSNVGDYTRYRGLDHWLLPMSSQRLNLDPLLQPYYPHRLDYQESVGIASTVLKPVAIRLTNVYAGLPVSFSLLGAWGGEPVTRSLGKPAYGLGFYPPTYDYHLETGNYLLTKLLSNPTELHDPLTNELKELLHLREQLLHNRNDNFNGRSSSSCNEEISKLPIDSPTSSFTKPTNPVTTTKRYLKQNSDKVTGMTKSNSGSQNVQLDMGNFEKNSSICLVPSQKSRKHFMLPIATSRKVKVVHDNKKTILDYVKGNTRNKGNHIKSSRNCTVSKTKLDQIYESGKNKKSQNGINILIKQSEESNELTSKTILNDNSDTKLDLTLTERSRSHQTSPCIKRMFHCHHCRYATDRKNNLKRHIVTMHQETSKTLECCGIVFKSKASLRDHNSVLHKGGYRCQICSRNFCRKALLRRHLTVHSGQKDFFCSLCGYATSHKSNLERHHKVHFKKDSPRSKRVISLRKKRHEENKAISFKKSSKLAFTRHISQDNNNITKNLSSKCTSNIDSGTRVARLNTKGSGKITKFTKGNDVADDTLDTKGNDVADDTLDTKGNDVADDTLDTKGNDVADDTLDTPLCLSEVNPYFAHNPEVFSHGDPAWASDKVISRSSSSSCSPSTSSITSHSVPDVCQTEGIKFGKPQLESVLEADNECSNIVNGLMTSSDRKKKRMFPMKYECSYCGRCFKLQTLLCLHELKSHSSEDILVNKGSQCYSST